MENGAELQISDLDEISRAIYLQLPREKIVMLQALVESYELLGFVRTLDMEKGLVVIVTTSNFIEDCFSLLRAVKDQIQWRVTPLPDIVGNPAGL